MKRKDLYRPLPPGVENIKTVLQYEVKEKAHEIVEGNAKGHGSRTRLSQAYPLGFCRRLAACLKSFKENKNQPSVDFVQESLLADLMDLIPGSLSGIWTLMKERTKGLACGVALASSTQELNMSAFIPVRHSPTRQLMAWGNALAQGTELMLNTDHHDWNKAIHPLVMGMCTQFLPRHRFYQCAILRGVFGIDADFMNRSDAVVVMWLKNDKVKRLMITTPRQLAVSPNFD